MREPGPRSLRRLEKSCTSDCGNARVAYVSQNDSFLGAQRGLIMRLLGKRNTFFWLRIWDWQQIVLAAFLSRPRMNSKYLAKL